MFLDKNKKNFQISYSLTKKMSEPVVQEVQQKEEVKTEPVTSEAKAQPKEVTYESRSPCPHFTPPKCGACASLPRYGGCLLDGLQSPAESLIVDWLYVVGVAILFGGFLSLLLRVVRRC